MKQKTNKAAAKRLKVTKSGKVKRQKRGKSHFKARQNSDQTRDQRKDADMSDSYKSTIKQMLPNKDIKN